MSDFMQPEIYEGSMWSVDGNFGETFLFPSDLFSKKDARQNVAGARNVEKLTGFFCRLSAPGYLDCTDWSGPFKTEAEASEYLSELYGDESEEEDDNDDDIAA